MTVPARMGGLVLIRGRRAMLEDAHEPTSPELLPVIANHAVAVIILVPRIDQAFLALVIEVSADPLDAAPVPLICSA